MDKTTKKCWHIQLNIASQILYSVLSMFGENIPEPAREALHKAIEAIAESDRIVRFTK